MYSIRPTTKFQKELKRLKKRGLDMSLLTDVIKKLAIGEPLPEKNRVISLLEIMVPVENAILLQIGC